MQAEEPSNKELKQWGCTVCPPLHPSTTCLFLLLWGCCSQHYVDSCVTSAQQHLEEFKMINEKKKKKTLSSSLYF